MSDQNENVEKRMEQAAEGSKIESRERAGESPEDRYEDKIIAAEILEEPKDGSFVHALQVFITWVNNLLANKKDE